LLSLLTRSSVHISQEYRLSAKCEQGVCWLLLCAQRDVFVFSSSPACLYA
jgi:hypothetical protein